MSEQTAELGVVSGDIFLKFFRTYGESVADQQQKASLVQQAIKRAEEAGLNVAAMKGLRTLLRMEPAHAAAKLRCEIAYAYILNAPFLSQTDIEFNGLSLGNYFRPLLEAMKVVAPSQKAKEAWTDYEAKEIGFNRGLKGGSLDDLNQQFAPGTSQNVAAAEGFKKGLEFMQQKGGAKAVSAGAGSGRRGPKAKLEAPEKPAKPPTARELKAQAKREAHEAAQATNAAKVVPIRKGEGDADFDTPRHDVPTNGAVVNLIKAQTMSASEMCAYYNSFSPAKPKTKFESRAAGIKALTDLYNLQRKSKFDAEDAAGAGADAPEAEPGDGWPLVASAASGGPPEEAPVDEDAEGEEDGQDEGDE